MTDVDVDEGAITAWESALDGVGAFVIVDRVGHAVASALAGDDEPRLALAIQGAAVEPDGSVWMQPTDVLHALDVVDVDTAFATRARWALSLASHIQGASVVLYPFSADMDFRVEPEADISTDEPVAKVLLSSIGSTEGAVTDFSIGMDQVVGRIGPGQPYVLAPESLLLEIVALTRLEAREPGEAIVLDEVIGTDGVVPGDVVHQLALLLPDTAPQVLVWCDTATTYAFFDPEDGAIELVPVSGDEVLEVVGAFLAQLDDLGSQAAPA